MDGYLSIAETAKRFGLSKRRVQFLCEQGRIKNATKLSGVWLVPANAQKPQDGRVKTSTGPEQLKLFDTSGDTTDGLLTLADVCELLSISTATGENWARLGKIVPVKKQGKSPLFSRSDIDQVLQAVTTGESQALNRRRNKKKINKVSLYESYISDSNNVEVINRIIVDYGSTMTPAVIRSVLANFALQLFCQKRQVPFADGNLLSKHIGGEFSASRFSRLIDDLIGSIDELATQVDLSSPIYDQKVTYVEGDDTLGFAYISLTNVGERKAKGAYYTPLTVVKRLISHLEDAVDIGGKRVFDPCCGSGNFLLEVARHSRTPEMIYGQDIDPTAIHLARISYAIEFDMLDLDFLYSHFVCADTFVSLPSSSFDIVLGNPPWGGEIPEDQLLPLSAKFKTAQKRSIETFSLFTEYSLMMLSEKGILAFVLPEAILNVKAHSVIREILLDECNFKFVDYLCEAFSGVNCPSIILGVEKSNKRVVGVPKVYHGNDCYSISSHRQMSIEQFSFRVKDEVQDCLESLANGPNVTTLLNQAQFALGIVTGNNAAYTSETHLPGYEPVLKGSDIRKYKFTHNGTYLKFEPQNFQQVAPVELYRAPEKLLYRFICDTLVFAYDDQQTLSLNSCNILIPQIPDTEIKYVLAVLNSRAAGFYFSNMFGSVKVLRSHIEGIPIPHASPKVQQDVIRMVDMIIYERGEVASLYEELDDYIMSLYGLDPKEKDIIHKSVMGQNLFLP